MRPFGSPKQLEKRRLRAVALLEEGLSLHEVARRVGCHPSSVLRWRETLREGGEAALAPRLTPRQKERLVRLLLRGPMAHGWRTELWTTQRIAQLIEEKFGVRYHRDHVGRLMHALGWSHQKPERRAIERDEAAIGRWKRKEWPRIKKTPPGWAPISSSSTSRASC
ncbi:MAG: transposase [Candidatus Rokubacteria bacterium]|nr:transposase [Candidatus Rokubacteria bacterium]